MAFNQKHYNRWRNMVRRCSDASHKQFMDYGGRGITVCSEWSTYQTFYAWASSTYIDGMVLDRSDNNAGYSPKNCRWVTVAENNRNKRSYKRTKSNLPPNVYANKNKFQVYFRVNGVFKHIGLYSTVEAATEAARSYRAP